MAAPNLAAPNRIQNYMKYLKNNLEKKGISQSLDDQAFKTFAYQSWRRLSDNEKDAFQTEIESLDDSPFGGAISPSGPPSYQSSSHSVSPSQSPRSVACSVVESCYTLPHEEADHRIPEQLPDTDDIHPEPQIPIRVREPYKMVLPIAKEIRELTDMIKNDYVTFPYCIVSSNMFLNANDICIPAEIGLAKFSFKLGIISTLHRFVDPGKSIPIYEIPTVIEYSQEWHKIPHEEFKEFVDIGKVMREFHAFIHIEELDGKAIIFAEADEEEQITDILRCFKTKSEELNLLLNWDKVQVYSLRTLFIFFINRLPMTDLHEADAHVAFKTSKYIYSDVCNFHDIQNCRYCAISKVHIFCYILSEHFSRQFGTPKLKRVKIKQTDRYAGLC